MANQKSKNIWNSKGTEKQNEDRSTFEPGKKPGSKIGRDGNGAPVQGPGNFSSRLIFFLFFFIKNSIF